MSVDLVYALLVESRVHHPQPALIHSEVDIRVSSPLPGGLLLLLEQSVMQGGPGCHVPQTQVKLDDVARKGPVVVKSSIVDHVTRSDPVIREFVGVR